VDLRSGGNKGLSEPFPWRLLSLPAQEGLHGVAHEHGYGHGAHSPRDRGYGRSPSSRGPETYVAADEVPARVASRTTPAAAVAADDAICAAICVATSIIAAPMVAAIGVVSLRWRQEPARACLLRRKHVKAHVDHHCPRLHPVPLHQARAPRGHDQHVGQRAGVFEPQRFRAVVLRDCG
jgi:hypothetical protein